MSALFILLVSLTRFSEKMLISTRCIHGFMSNLIKKSWTDSSAESAKIFLNSFVKMPDYHFPTCFSHKEIARLDFLSCTKWKQIEANSVCSAEESRIGEILCCYSETEQNRARYIQLTFSFYVKWPGEKKLWSSSSSRSVSRTRPGGTYGDGWDLSL